MQKKFFACTLYLPQLSSKVTKLAINQLLGQQLITMYATDTLTHAAEMTLPADNGCCTTTFPLCTRRPRVNMAKSKTKLKKFDQKSLIFMSLICKAFYFNFLPSVFLFSYCRGSFSRYFLAKMAFSMTSRLHYLYLVGRKF